MLQNYELYFKVDNTFKIKSIFYLNLQALFIIFAEDKALSLY
jgi:hypothetical protein